MKRTLIYGLILVVLLAIGFYAIKKDSFSEISDKDFAIANVDEISKIELENKQQQTMTLTKVDGAWLVNNEHKARKQFVEELLFTMKNIYTYAPVAKTAHENVIKQMSKKSTKVKVYFNGKKQADKVYYVGGLAPTNDGTNFLMDINGKPASQVYIVKLPGHKGYVSEVFHIDNELWRSRDLFNYTPNEIQSIKVNYLDADSVHSYELRNNNNSFTLITPNYTFDHTRINAAAVTNYLLGFANKSIETYDTKGDDMEAVLAKNKYAVLTITETGGNQKVIPIYYMPVNESSKLQYDDEGNKMLYDVDKYYALVNDQKEWAVIQKYTFDEILQHSNNFLKK